MRANGDVAHQAANMDTPGSLKHRNGYGAMAEIGRVQSHGVAIKKVYDA